MKTAVAALFILTLSIVGVRAASTPEEMTVLYFDSFKKGDVDTIVANMHEGELGKFQKALIPVIEKNVEQDPTGAGRDAAAIRQLVGKNTIDEIRQETPQAFFARFLNWMIKLNPSTIKSMAGATMQPLGHIEEEDMAHVTCRVNVVIMGATISQLKVMSVKKQSDEWKLMLTGEIEGMAKLMQMNPRMQQQP